MIFEKNSTELMQLVKQSNKGVPIIIAFEYEAQNYKYGKEIYCNVLKKQIEECFCFTESWARDELCRMKEYRDKIVIDYEDKDIILTSSPDISSWTEEYIYRWDTPEEQKEYEALNELSKYILQLTPATDSKAPKLPAPEVAPREKQHTAIFDGYAFELLKRLFNDFGIKESSRTDVKFIFEEMKRDGFIHDTVSQERFLSWINDTYEMVIEKTSNYSRIRKRLVIYDNAKQAYKRTGI